MKRVEAALVKIHPWTEMIEGATNMPSQPPQENEIKNAADSADIVMHSLDAVRLEKRIDGFGKGEYRYFKYPLPDLIQALRTALYPCLANVANDWNRRMGIAETFPRAHTDYLQLCHDAGQIRPTPLLLQYVAGDYNCLHQDLYGDMAFPIQVAILLSEPGRDFTGGEFVLTEQRPRMQSCAEVVPLRQRAMPSHLLSTAGR